MKTLKLTLPLVALASVVLAGCPGEDPPGMETEGTTTDTTTTEDPTVTPPVTMTNPDTTVTVGEDTTVTGGTETETSNTTEPEPGPFEFAETPFDEYTQVDRKGFPAVNAGLNLLGDKDAYNQGTPLQDAAGAFEATFLESLEILHLGVPGMQAADNTGLDDDLATFGFEACVPPPMALDNCDDQAGPFAIPDVLTIDLDDEPGFPNGRRLEDPVMDIIFAVLLLDLDSEPVTSFLDLDSDGTPGPWLNPPENDVAFPGQFPYLAPANE